MNQSPYGFEFLGQEVAHLANGEFVITSNGNSYAEKFFNKLLPYLCDFLYSLLPEGTRFQGIKISAFSNEIVDLLSSVPELHGNGSALKIGGDGTKQYMPIPSNYTSRCIERTDISNSDATPDEMDAKYFSLGGMQSKYSANLIQDPDGELRLSEIDTDHWYGNVVVKSENTTDSLRNSGINEFYCMQLAGRCGLDVPNTFLLLNENNGYDYVVERFGIIPSSDGKYRKAIVIDVAVLFGKVFMENKYRSSSPELFGVMQGILSVADFKKFALAYTFGYIIGNADMHLRNFSLFAHYDEEHDALTFALTPIYDMQCTKCYTRFAHNDLGLGLYATGISGAVSEKEYLGFISEFLSLEEVATLATNIEEQYINVRDYVVELVGDQYSSFLNAICDIIKSREENITALIDDIHAE